MIVLHMMIEEKHTIIVKRLLMKNKIHTWLLMKIKCTHDCSWKKSTLSIIRPRYSRLNFIYQKLAVTKQEVYCFISTVIQATLNTKYIWAVLIKLHDSATYDDRRKAYESVLFGPFYWWRKPEFPEKPPICRKSLTNFII
jgi:hypothetical protein